MTFAPARIVAVRTYMHEKTGLEPVSLGIVGSESHRRKGQSYHLGASDLRFDLDPYSARTARDRNGLTDAASALDIGWFKQLQALSIALVNDCRAGAPDTHDIREIIYSPDRRTVLRYDRERGVASMPRPGEADSSHLSHTHISWYRDSEGRDKLSPFIRFFENRIIAPIQPVARTWTEVIVESLPILRQGATGISVRRLQALLNVVGAGLKEDGIFGPATERALRTAQSRSKIAADGVAGRDTYAVLLGVRK